MKATRHNGRSGKHGTYDAKHNDRSINVNIKMYKSSKIIMYKFPSFLFLYDPSIDKIFQIL